MSRIILSRHSNGEEYITCGFDRPLQSFFIDQYDEEGDCVATRGPISGEQLELSDILTVLEILEVKESTINKVRLLLKEHQELEYQASNVVLDLSRTTE